MLEKLTKLINLSRTNSYNVKFGLRTKFILAFLILVIIPFLTLGIVLYKQSSKIVEKNAYLYSTETMRQIAKNIDYYLKDLDRITQSTSADEHLVTYLNDYNSMSTLEKLDASSEINKRLLNLSGLRSDLSGVYLFDSNSNFFYSRGRSPRLGFDIKNEQWYKETLAKFGNINLIGTHLQYHVQINPAYVISVSRVILDFNSRKPLGVILVDLDYNVLDKIISNDSNSSLSEGEIYVLDNKGTIIFNHNQNLLTKNFQYDFYGKIADQIQGNFTATINNQQMLVVFYTSPYSSWKVVRITPKERILIDVTIIKNTIIVIMIVFTVVILIFSTEVSYKLVKPIKILVSAMAEMENGNLSANVTIKTNDEIRLLADSFNSMSKNIKNLIEKVYTAQLKQKEAELSALQSQINPHFLYNTLESIRGVAIVNGIDSIAEMSKSLSNLFRYNIKGKEIVTINDEIDHIKNYVTIQNFRFEDRFKVIYDIDPTLKHYKMLKFLLQPLVENAIHHGFEKKDAQGEIKISCERIKDTIRFKIIDDGLGIPVNKINLINDSLKNPVFETNSASGDRSIGIMNVNTRIKLYFGTEYGLNFISKEGLGTSVEVYIPVIEGGKNDKDISS